MNKTYVLVTFLVVLIGGVSCSSHEATNIEQIKSSNILCSSLENAMTTTDEHICHLFKMLDDPCVHTGINVNVDFFRYFNWSKVSGSNVKTYWNKNGCYSISSKLIDSPNFNYFHFTNNSNVLGYQVVKKLSNKEEYLQNRERLEYIIEKMPSEIIQFEKQLFVLESYNNGQLKRGFVADNLDLEQRLLLENL